MSAPTTLTEGSHEGSQNEGYAELQVTSNFSFLRGASHPHELVATAAALGLNAIAITDRNSLAGVVRLHVAAKEIGMRVIIGCRLDLADGLSLLCYPTDRAAYGRLCRLLTHGKMPPTPKGECHLTLEDVKAHAEGQIFIALPPDDGPPEDLEGGGGAFTERLTHLARLWPGRMYLAASHRYAGTDRARIGQLDALARTAGAPLVATGDVLHHTPERQPLQDILSCIRQGCAIHEAGRRLEKNADRHLKPAAEMVRRFTGFEDAVARTQDIAARCTFNLNELKYEYPDEIGRASCRERV